MVPSDPMETEVEWVYPSIFARFSACRGSERKGNVKVGVAKGRRLSRGIAEGMELHAGASKGRGLKQLANKPRPQARVSKGRASYGVAN